MWATSLVAGRVSRADALSPRVGIHCQPRFVAAGARGGWAFWTRQRDGLWEVVGRRLVDGRWLPLAILSDTRHPAMMPGALVAGSAVTLLYEQHSVPQRIVMRIRESGQWSAPPPRSVTAAPLAAGLCCPPARRVKSGHSGIPIWLPKLER
jgi:hypothetical protein